MRIRQFLSAPTLRRSRAGSPEPGSTSLKPGAFETQKDPEDGLESREHLRAWFNLGYEPAGNVTARIEKPRRLGLTSECGAPFVNK
jgi:hypothetical protein